MALKSTTSALRLASVADLIGIDTAELEDAFVCEEWSAELSTGLVWLGPETAMLHGAAATRCGIMDLIQVYDPGDWQKVLLALEEAATIPTTFSFATTIRPGPGLYRPVFCVGRSETIDGTSGIIQGTFAVARLCLETTAAKHDTLN